MLSTAIRSSNDFICFHAHWYCRGEVLPAAVQCHFHGIVQKNPFTMSKTDDRPNAESQVITGASCATANWLPTPWKVKLLAHAAKRAAGDGGAYRDRTDDLMLAKQPLSQLS
jgi:hypothetical protein